MARQARQSEPRSARLCRRDRGRDQHGAPLWPQSVRPAPGWADPPWPLEGDHVRRRPHRPRLRRPLRARRPDERRHLQGLDRADARPGAAAGRHRDHGQSRRSQSRRHRESDHRSRRRAALSAALLADLNPIEQAFAKLKALLRKAAERSVDGLWNAIGRLLDLFPPAECANYLANAGYPRSA